MNQIEALGGKRPDGAASVTLAPPVSTPVAARATVLERTSAMEPCHREREMTADLPIVSVIIVNFNYGRYLARAVASVFAQTYPRIECLVVDDASSDDSADVIAACQACHPGLSVHCRAINGGQTSASFDGLARTRGPFVIFLDADDYLLPQCVETQVCVHLSTRVHVGFTSADMLQIVDDQIVLSTNEPMATYVRGLGQAERNQVLRPSRAALGALWDRFDQSLPDRVHLVPATHRRWIWSPTSGNCFRRDALELFRDAEGLGGLRSQTDLFLTVGINAISGSILIDEPLFGYRLHGANAFTKRPQLSGVLAYDPGDTNDSARLARCLLIDHFIRRIDRFAQVAGRHHDIITMLRSLDVADEAGGGPRWARQSRVARTLARHWPDMVETHGRDEASRLMSKGGVPWHARLALLAKREDSGGVRRRGRDSA